MLGRPLEQQDVSQLEYGDKVVSMVAGMDLARIMADERTVFAVCYGIQVVGEAGWTLSDAIKLQHTEIPWPLIVGMRHRLVHDYGRTDESVVFSVATVQLPKLLAQVRANLDRFHPQPAGQLRDLVVRRRGEHALDQ